MRIVYATDRSAASEAAIGSESTLECLADIGVTEVHLFTVVPDNVAGPLPGTDVAADARAALSGPRSAFESAGFDVELHVARGAPFRRINGLAERLPADMIVVGSRGKSPLRNRLIGDTVRNVARTAVVPLLVERIESDGSSHAMATDHLFRHVLFVTDFSDNAERAYEFLRRIRTAISRVSLLHVRGREQRQGDASAESARRRLSELALDLEDRFGVETETLVRSGGTVEEILATERRIDPSVTLLGARGTSRLRRLLLGSVSESVIAQGTTNVLLVPPASEPPR